VGRACLAAASVVGAVSTSIAARVTTAEGTQRRIAELDCTVANRFTIHCSGRNAVRVAPIECYITIEITAGDRRPLLEDGREF